MLQEQSGLNLRQISNWFSNARRRAVPGPSKGPALVHQASRSVPDLAASQRWEDLNPLDRWRNSPPEEEPASWSAIVQAAPFAKDVESTTWPLQSLASRPQSDTSLESSLPGWTSNSSTTTRSAGSNDSHLASSSVGSLTRVSRRRRRQYAQPRNAFRQSQAELQERPYQCTFCTDRFKSKYDWTRHEGTLHLVLEQWVCTAFGPIVSNASGGVHQCCFCQELNPSLSHLRSHKYDACAEKPVAEKTFYRKDHLRQHLRLVHGINKIQPLMSAWRRQIISVNSRCGFCAEQFTMWSERNEHIAEHFREGVSMRDWKGCRGLDPAVALLVENAMPPYLIATEVNEFEPFSASSARWEGQSPLGGSRAAPTTFETLTVRLGEYVQEAINQDTVVTDDTVRKQARLIMFGDDDAWNQTPADNAEWLRLFKEGLNLSAAQIKPVANMHNSASGCSVPKTGQLGSGCANFNMLIHPTADQTTDHGGTSQLCSLSGLPLSWQTPECLAEFRQMLHQLPEQIIPSSTTLAEGRDNGLSQAWSSPALQRSFLGQTSDQSRPQYYPHPASFDAPGIETTCLGTLDFTDLMFPFDLGLFEE